MPSIDDIISKSIEDRSQPTTLRDTLAPPVEQTAVQPIDAVVAQSVEDRGSTADALLEAQQPERSESGFIIPPAITEEGKAIDTLVNLAIARDKLGLKPDRSDEYEDIPGQDKEEILFKLRNAHFNDRLEEEFGMTSDDFSIGMLSAAFALNARPEERVNFLKKWLKTDDVYLSDYDGQDFITIVGEDGKVNELPINVGGVSAQDILDLSIEAGAGVTAGMATGGLSFWGQLLAGGLSSAGVSLAKDTASMPFGAEGGPDIGRSAEAGLADVGFGLAIEGLAKAGGVAGTMLSEGYQFLKTHAKPLLKRTKLFKNVAEGAADFAKAEDLGIVASLGSSDVTRVAEQMVKAGRSVDEINAKLGTEFTESMYAASELGFMKESLKKYGTHTDELGDKLLKSKKQLFVENVKFLDDISALKSAEGAIEIKGASEKILKQAIDEKRAAGDGMQKLLEDNDDIKVNIFKRFVEPMTRLKNRLAGESTFENNIDKMIKAAVPKANHAEIDALRSAMKVRAKKIAADSKKVGRREKVMTLLPTQKAKKGGPKAMAEELNALTTGLDQMRAQQLLDKERLGELMSIPPTNIKLVKDELEEMLNSKEISGRAFSAGLSRVNKILVDIVPELKVHKAEYSALANKLNLLEKSPIGKIADAETLSAKILGAKIFAVKDPEVIKTSLDMISSVHPDSANLIVKDQLMEMMRIDDATIELIKSGGDLRLPRNLKEEEFGVIPKNLMARLDSIFEPGNAKATAIREWISKDPSKKQVLDLLGQASGIAKGTESLIKAGEAAKAGQSVGSSPIVTGNLIGDVARITSFITRLSKIDDQEAVAKGFHALLTSNGKEANRIRKAILDDDLWKKNTHANMLKVGGLLKNLGKLAGRVKAAESRRNTDRTRLKKASGGGDFIGNLTDYGTF